MAEIIGNIYREYNYDLFKRLENNRNVYENRIGKLIASIKEKYITNPIIVNEKMQIIDGQGRFEALKRLGRPIDYIIVDGVDYRDCVRMNKYNSKWTTKDFADSYAKSGRIDYKRLLETCADVGLSISYVLRLGNRGSKSRSENMSAYERGELVFSEQDKTKVQIVKKYADEIADALQFQLRRNEAFYSGVKVICEHSLYKHNRMLKNCAALRSSYHQMSTLKQQLEEFERIYNYRSPSDKKIWFSDYMRNKGSNVRDYSETKKRYDNKDVSSLKAYDE